MASGRCAAGTHKAGLTCSLLPCVPPNSQEEIPLHAANIYAIVYARGLNCLITGGEDATIQLFYLSGEVPIFNDVPLPTSLTVRRGAAVEAAEADDAGDGARIRVLALLHASASRKARAAREQLCSEQHQRKSRMLPARVRLACAARCTLRLSPPEAWRPRARRSTRLA